MLRHTYTLQKVTENLQNLCGFQIIECFSQDRDTLIISLYNGNFLSYIQFSCDSQLASILIRNKFERARANSVDLFPEIIGDTIKEVAISQWDRIISLKLNKTDLVAMLFGGAKSNLYAVDKNNIIINTFKSGNKNIGKELVLPQPNISAFRAFPQTSGIVDALSRCHILLGKYYAAELIARLEIDNKKIISDFSSEELFEIESKANMLRDECLNTKQFYLLKNEDDDYIFSLIQLKKYPVNVATFTNISEAIQRRLGYFHREQSFQTQFKQIEFKLVNTQKKLSVNIEKTTEQVTGNLRSEQFKLWADLLASQPNPKQKSGNIISLEDWEGNPLQISLDPKLNILQNSELYYEKSRRIRELINTKRKLLPELQKKLELINSLIRQLNETENIKELNRIKDMVKNINGIQFESEQNEPESKYKVFELGEGYTLYIGKNAANNDELTMKFAKPNDLWLHARGSAGSHAVLKSPQKELKPPRGILQKAAEIVAYFSQARRAKYVHVCYTQKKNVHKPKGADPGSVVVSREEVIMVEPKLPEG